jgi:hypothetical protein
MSELRVERLLRGVIGVRAKEGDDPLQRVHNLDEEEHPEGDEGWKD